MISCFLLSVECNNTITYCGAQNYYNGNYSSYRQELVQLWVYFYSERRHKWLKSVIGDWILEKCHLQAPHQGNTPRIWSGDEEMPRGEHWFGVRFRSMDSVIGDWFLEKCHLQATHPGNTPRIWSGDEEMPRGEHQLQIGLLTYRNTTYLQLYTIKLLPQRRL